MWSVRFRDRPSVAVLSLVDTFSLILHNETTRTAANQPAKGFRICPLTFLAAEGGALGYRVVGAVQLHVSAVTARALTGQAFGLHYSCYCK